MTILTERDEQGRFSVGNPGGPGRPRRAVELDYQRVMAEACSLDDWKAIVQKAVTDAKEGDPKAREFIAARMIGANPLQLTGLALRELLNITADEELAAKGTLELETAREFGAVARTTLQNVILSRERARNVANREARERQEAEEREQRRAERENKKRMRALETQLGAPHVEDMPE